MNRSRTQGLPTCLELMWGRKSVSLVSDRSVNERTVGIDSRGVRGAGAGVGKLFLEDWEIGHPLPSLKDIPKMSKLSGNIE